MFIVLITYQKPLSEVDKYLAAHRDYLTTGYEKNYLICSGPQNPRTGGILLSQLSNRTTLEEFIAHDPFYINKVVSYEIIEFNPVKYHEDFAHFIS